MVFADELFLFLFLPLCLAFYFIMPRVQMKNNVLILFSLVFYAWGEQLYLLLLLASSLINYAAGRLLQRYRDTETGKACLTLSLIVNIGVLVAFKYSGFIAENLNLIPFIDIPVPDMHMPIGISFFTFQNISYTLDVWWDKTGAQRSFRKYMLYISMFPQLVAGPIVRYSAIAEEIDERKTTLEDLSAGFSRLIIGVAKKVIIANNLNSAVTAVLGQSSDGYAAADSLTTLGAWYGAILVALWYYFDFSGYSDIAIGLGRIFGFHFDENFNYPFACKSISEFWQRWHISLGSFFRDYLLYVPIFGKRRKYGGLFLVWFCTGLWHGASWNFILWGLYYGVFIAIESAIGKKRMKRMPRALAHIYTKIVIVVGFGIFYFESLSSLGKFFKALVGLGSGLTNAVTNTIFMQYVFLFAAAILLSLPIIKAIKSRASRSTSGTAVISTVGVLCNVVLLAVSAILLLNTTNNPFLYFRF
ncbi:MAG: MBOAT family protein [Ruminococcus sp.]|nr:MBOAT family protein [Ruminococcus sp.]